VQHVLTNALLTALAKVQANTLLMQQLALIAVLVQAFALLTHQNPNNQKLF
jgi:hypothetical protein